MMEIGKMIQRTDMGNMYMRTEIPTAGTGLMIYNKDMDENNGTMVLFMRVSIRREKRMVKENTNGQTEALMKDNG